ncbi:MAG: hypothetical protein QOK40_663 [Miltoncostaeaceae bacterium]|nr:hypothetical protein [Miltoncostaeaceae bacterium]
MPETASIAVLDAATEALERAGGGEGRDALDRAGFLTRRWDERWLSKGIGDGVLVELIFIPSDMHLDEQLLEPPDGVELMS